MGEGAKRVRRSGTLRVQRLEAAEAALLAGLVDEDPGEQDEHRMGEPAGEDDRGDPDQEGQYRDERPPGEKDRERRQKKGEDVIHRPKMGRGARRRKAAGYHRRINAMLRTWMLALISKEVLSRSDKDRRADEIWGKAAPMLE